MRSLRIVTAVGETVTPAVNEDDAYWITIADPSAQTVTLLDGTERSIPVARGETPEWPAGRD